MRSEVDRLTDVLLCAPDDLAAVPCCAVTRDSIARGHVTCRDAATRQHAALVSTLQDEGVRCHWLAPDPDLPDMCFTRDIGVATPFGLVALNPASPHRRGEADALVSACARWGIPVTRITSGTLEGGDVCVARDGLLLVGQSGERSTEEGISAFAAPFRAAGWDVIVCRFDARHLHLDTIFCMISHDTAIGCVDLLEPGFVEAVRARGIRILPVASAAAGSLACNVLSLGNRRILASTADERVPGMLRAAGFAVRTLDISEFSACGGGIHCLTQPLRRVPQDALA